MACLASCSLFDTFDEVPMFLDIESVEFESIPVQGFNTSNITAVEAFVDGFSVGVFSLPAKIPVLQTNDSVDVAIFAVIRNNGITSNPVKYPFYKEAEYVLDFEAGKNVPLKPVFRYRSDAIVVPTCDFESNICITNNIDNNTDIVFERSTETDYGNFCGKITIPEANTFFEKSSFQSFLKSDLNGNIAFLEMDYRCETNFGVGVVLSGQGVPDFPAYTLVLNPQETWNKIYIEISQLISVANVESFQLLFGTTTATTDPGSIWIDNLKVVYF